MARTHLTKLGRAIGQALKGRNAAALNATPPSSFSRGPQMTYSASRLAHASFSTSPRFAKPIPPEALKTAIPAELAPSEYHELADQYMDDILARFEEEQDKNGEIDVEYSVRAPPGVSNVLYI
jgi:frataxin